MRSFSIAVAIWFGLLMPGCSQSTNSSDNPDYIAAINDGMPFGEVADSDADALMAFAKENGVDLEKAAERAYRKDTDALATMFKFSSKFTTLDKNARFYGQMVWSSLLNLGETWSVDKYAEVLNSQDTDVQQRIRDILYYPTVHIPELMTERRKGEQAARKDYPKLFPKDYEFGRNDSVFR